MATGSPESACYSSIGRGIGDADPAGSADRPNKVHGGSL
jgi:hypothetical protein